MKILVGLSGGVDSAVAAYLLSKQGHTVTGVTMSIWDKNSPLKAAHRDACFSPAEDQDIAEAKNICAKLGVRHEVVDCTQAYKQVVLENFKRDYLSGRTPNPCVWCNGQIKFRVLPDSAKAAGIDFDLFATGHYANVVRFEQTGRFALKKAADPKKDQTYFIYRLTQEQLASVTFPLGEMTKERVRQTARDIGLAVSDKPDSQDFYAGHYGDLLDATDKDGVFVDVDGRVLGRHKGFWHYTVGQRKGLGIAAKKPLYVLRLNAERNEVVLAEKEAVLTRDAVAENCVWSAIDGLTEERRVTAKLRSTQTPAAAVAFPKRCRSSFTTATPFWAAVF